MEENGNDSLAHSAIEVGPIAGDSTPFLLFSVQNALYALPALAVREIHLLPELTPLDGASPHMVGVLDLRGEVISVMDLATRLGRTPQSLDVNNSLLVLEWKGSIFGLWVSQVLNVCPIPLSLRGPVPAFNGAENAAQLPTENLFLDGVARLDDRIVMLLRLDALLQAPVAVHAETDDWQKPDLSDPSSQILAPSVFSRGVFAPHLSADERAIFALRATRLRQRGNQTSTDGLSPVAIISLGGETFGIALHQIGEFCTLRTPTPVPCCPPHILGQMNLRGDILTLVDVRHLLRVSLAPVVGGESKVVVVQHENSLTGIVVDDVVDVISLPGHHLGNSVELGQDERASVVNGRGQYLQGGAPYGGRILYLLDLPKLLSEGELIVEENV